MIDADGGVPRRLTDEPSADTTGTWSRDGKWIYFTSDRTGERQIWKLPAEGGEAVQVTQGGGNYPQESWDGRVLYYMKSGAIWTVPVQGGKEKEVVHGPLSLLGDWAVSPTRLYYFQWEQLLPRQRRFTVRVFDLRSKTETELFRSEGPFKRRYLAVSPDDKWILYGQRPYDASELMLVENFR